MWKGICMAISKFIIFKTGNRDNFKGSISLNQRLIPWPWDLISKFLIKMLINKKCFKKQMTKISLITVGWKNCKQSVITNKSTFFIKKQDKKVSTLKLYSIRHWPNSPYNKSKWECQSKLKLHWRYLVFYYEK